ncbi:MAG: hypothetical protein ABI588_01585, partial [Arenimonas sp.]
MVLALDFPLVLRNSFQHRDQLDLLGNRFLPEAMFVDAAEDEPAPDLGDVCPEHDQAKAFCSQLLPRRLC